MRYRTGRRTGGRAFDKPRWVAARLRVEVGRDLTMRAVPEIATEPAPAAARKAVERRTPRRPD
jgi:hypothetical protein